MMRCEIRKIGAVTLFSIHGDVIFNHLSHIRETIWGEIVQSSTGKYLIDMDEVGTIDSAGVGFIVSVYKTVSSRKGTFALVRPNGTVKNVLQTVGLSRLFNIYESEDEAIKAII